MKCYFCQQTIPKDFVHLSTYTFNLEIGDCPTCRRDGIKTTTVSELEKIITAHLYVEMKGHRYQVLLHLENNYFALNDLNAAVDKIQIIRLEFIPNITVSNVVQKISTILIFQ